MESTPLSYIDTPEQLMRAVEEMQGASEVAVDLEVRHHCGSYRDLMVY